MNLLTFVFGFIGATCLLASLNRRDDSAQRLCVAVLVGWMLTNLSCYLLPLGYPTVLYFLLFSEITLSLLVLVETIRRPSLSGAILLGLFALQMTINVNFYVSNGIEEGDFHTAIRLVYLAQAFAAGGRNLFVVTFGAITSRHDTY